MGNSVGTPKVEPENALHHVIVSEGQEAKVGTLGAHEFARLGSHAQLMRRSRAGQEAKFAGSAAALGNPSRSGVLSRSPSPRRRRLVIHAKVPSNSKRAVDDSSCGTDFPELLDEEPDAEAEDSSETQQLRRLSAQGMRTPRKSLSAPSLQRLSGPRSQGHQPELGESPISPVSSPRSSWRISAPSGTLEPTLKKHGNVRRAKSMRLSSRRTRRPSQAFEEYIKMIASAQAIPSLLNLHMKTNQLHASNFEGKAERMNARRKRRTAAVGFTMQYAQSARDVGKYASLLGESRASLQRERLIDHENHWLTVRLKRLKSMLRNRFISPPQYNQKRHEILELHRLRKDIITDAAPDLKSSAINYELVKLQMHQELAKKRPQRKLRPVSLPLNARLGNIPELSSFDRPRVRSVPQRGLGQLPVGQEDFPAAVEESTETAATSNMVDLEPTDVAGLEKTLAHFGCSVERKEEDPTIPHCALQLGVDTAVSKAGMYNKVLNTHLGSHPPRSPVDAGTLSRYVVCAKQCFVHT